MANLVDIVRYMDAELRTTEVPDYDQALNGLQLANSGRVTKLAAAVDFSKNSVELAIQKGASLLVVHHGMFWAGAQRIVGVHYERLRAALDGDLAVYSSHIPLDAHPELGNNALLARELELTAEEGFGEYRNITIGVSGRSEQPTALIVQRARTFAQRYATSVVVTPFAEGRMTRRWGIITGAGASSATLAEARARGIDTLIVGEGAHHTGVEAAEHGMVVIYAGHYATETLGVQALALKVGAHFKLESSFLDVPTGL
jgi:dinuclear metal center YbgI/SA1388 family protein